MKLSTTFLPSFSLMRFVTLMGWVSALLNASLMLAWQSEARAQATATMTILHRFTANGDGAESRATLVQDTDGTIYGTTRGGGSFGNGTLFKITPGGTVTILHRFAYQDANGNPGLGADGAYPINSLTAGADGNFYGTAPSGGANKSGTFYRITPTGDFTLLHTFNADDGSFPSGKALLASDGNFYGTTSYGGTYGYGVVYRITPTGELTIVHSFAGGDENLSPTGELLEGSDGSIYGLAGGHFDPRHDIPFPASFGSIFRLTADGVLTTLHTFSGGDDGCYPRGGLVRDADGNFYGTTSGGGQDGKGTVYRLTQNRVLTTIHSFSGPDGHGPESGLVLGSDGNFYGTTVGNGSDNSGTVYRLTPGGEFAVLYAFATDYSVGALPYSGLVQGQDGAFYGTTSTGGDPDAGINNTAGTVFRLDVPPAVVHPAFFDGAVAVGNDASYLAFPDGHYFGYYSFLTDSNYLYHFDLGYEYVIDAADGRGGIYLYDFASNTFFYTSTGSPFSYLYDFTLNTVLYYYPDPKNAGHYNTDGVRYFYRFDTGAIISK